MEPEIETTNEETAPPAPRTCDEHVFDMTEQGIMDGRVLKVLADLQERVTALEATATAPKSTKTT